MQPRRVYRGNVRYLTASSCRAMATSIMKLRIVPTPGQVRNMILILWAGLRMTPEIHSSEMASSGSGRYCSQWQPCLSRSPHKEIIEEFHINQEVFEFGLSDFVLGFAVGPVFWGPLSELYGRQIVVVGTVSQANGIN